MKTTNYPQIISLNNFSPQIGTSESSEVYQNLIKRDYSQNTQTAIKADLRDFVQWYIGRNSEAFDVKRLTEREVAEYKQFYIEKGLAPRTINRKLVSLSLYCQTAVELELRHDNPTKRIKQLPLQKLSPKSLTSQEIRKLLKEVELQKNSRDELVVKLLLFAGLRSSEVIGLGVSDVNITERKEHLLVRNSKGNKTRQVPLENNLRILIGDYLQKYNPSQQLIVGKRGCLKSVISINKILEKYAERAKIKCHPHTLRHCFAYNFIQKNQSDIVALSQILGHGNIATTGIYCQNRLEDLQEKVEGMSF